MRCDWSRSPWIGSAFSPCFLSDFATISTSTLRLQKMIALVQASPSAVDGGAQHLAFLAWRPVAARRRELDQALLDRVGRRGLARDLDPLGVRQEGVGDPLDLGRHGGGEEQRLAGEGHKAEDALDIGDEAHVEHAVGLVDDHHLDVRQDQLAAFEMVEQAAGRGDQDIDALVDQRVLLLEADAADQERLGELHVLGIGVEVLRHLRGQFPRRAQEGQHELRGMRARARPRASAVIIGSVKLAVLPVPVCAMPRTSRPSSAGGMAPAWIGVGVS
jgi:hypothetical protein